MAKYTASFTSDGTVQLCYVIKKRDFRDWLATIIATGTFGGGTITWQISADGGTTKTALKDISGADQTSNAADNFTIELGSGGTVNDAPILYATLAGSTAPNIAITVFDNN